MKRFTLLGFALVWLACDTPSAPTTSGLSTAPFFDRQHFNESFPVSGFAFNTCPPEEVVFVEGRFHVNQTVETAPDGSETIKFHLNAQDVRGVGLTTGLKYRFLDNEKDDFSFTPSPTSQSEEFDQRFRLIRQGSLDNLWSRFTFRFTFPPGDFVVIRDEIECRG